MKSNYDGFKGWLNYIRDYKDNKNLLGENLKEKELQDTIDKLTTNSKEKDNLLALRNQRIDVLNQEITDLKKRNDELRRNLGTTMKVNNELQEKVEEKEKARRRNAGAIGGLKAKINELEEQLMKAEHTINFYKTHQKSPTIEEINAYCKERNNGIDGEKFYDFYESKGWMVGKNKMKDWKACIRTWEQKDKKQDNLPKWFGKDFKKEDEGIDELNKLLEDFN